MCKPRQDSDPNPKQPLENTCVHVTAQGKWVGDFPPWLYPQT